MKSNGMQTTLNRQFESTFYKNIDLDEMLNYLLNIRKFQNHNARSLVNYLRRQAYDLKDAKIIMVFSNDPLNISALSLFFNHHHMIGSQQNGVEYLYEALDYVAKGKVKVMTETFSLEDISSS